MICPSCKGKVSESEWLCPYCEHILDPSVLGVDVDQPQGQAQRAEITKIVAWAPGPEASMPQEEPPDAMILGEVGVQEKDFEVVPGAGANQNGRTSTFLFYTSGATSRIVHPDAVPKLTQRDATIPRTPYEDFILSLVDGARSVREIQRASGLAPQEVVITLLTLLDKGVISIEVPGALSPARRRSSIDGDETHDGSGTVEKGSADPELTDPPVFADQDQTVDGLAPLDPHSPSSTGAAIPEADLEDLPSVRDFQEIEDDEDESDDVYQEEGPTAEIFEGDLAPLKTIAAPPPLPKATTPRPEIEKNDVVRPRDLDSSDSEMITDHGPKQVLPSRKRSRASGRRAQKIEDPSERREKPGAKIARPLSESPKLEPEAKPEPKPEPKPPAKLPPPPPPPSKAEKEATPNSVEVKGTPAKKGQWSEGQEIRESSSPPPLASGGRLGTPPPVLDASFLVEVPKSVVAPKPKVEAPPEDKAPPEDEAPPEDKTPPPTSLVRSLPPLSITEDSDSAAAPPPPSGQSQPLVQAEKRSMPSVAKRSSVEERDRRNDELDRKKDEPKRSDGRRDARATKPGPKSLAFSPAGEERKIPAGAEGALMLKAQKFYDQALKDKADGNLLSARMNMKLSVTFDPHNELYKKAFDQLQRMGPVVNASSASTKSRAREFYDLATQKEELGDVDEACALLEKALKESKEPAFYNRLGVILATKKRQFARAQQLIETAIEMAPSNATYQHNLGKVLSMAAAHDVAIRNAPGGGKKAGLLGLLGRKK